MFESFKKKSLQKHTEKQLLQRDISGLNSKLKTLAFLVDEAVFQDFDKIYDLYKIFNLHPKDVSVFSFLEVKRKLPTLRQNQIHNKDFNWKGEITNQNAMDFLHQNFDILVGYYQGKHPFLDLMVSQSKAKFKVGFTHTNDRLFDLIINASATDFTTFTSELKKYATLLNKL